MSKKLNIFASSKKQGFLECLKPRDGWVIVSSDINSLEPHVLAHFSQDPGYLKIYHKNAAPNCIYLYFGAHSTEHGHLFRTVYDPNNSTKESVALAKKLYDAERQIYKVGVLTLAYEGTEYALDRRYRKEGLNVDWDKLTYLVKLFKNTFAGLPEFRSKLQYEWKQRGGYILTGRGRPLVVSRNKTDDIIADFCQSTGHDYLMRLIWHMQQYRAKHKLRCIPFIPDFHDASYWQCPDMIDDIEATKAMFKYGYEALNKELELDVVFKGEIKVKHTMSA